MKLYKLTDHNHQTRNNTQWGPGVSHSGTGKGRLCSKGYIHAYTHPLLAVLLAPLHVLWSAPALWEAEGDVVLSDLGLKVGCVTLTTTKQIEMPIVTTEQRVRFAILCATEVYEEPGFVAWAEGWLSGKNQAAEAEAAARAAAWAAWAAAAEAEAEAEAEAAAAAWAAWAAAAAAWAGSDRTAAEAAAEAAAKGIDLRVVLQECGL